MGFRQSGKYKTEAYRFWDADEGKVRVTDACDYDLPIPPEFLRGTDVKHEVVVDFIATGYYYPATWLEPCEGDEKRELNEAYLMLEGERIDLPPKVQNSLFNRFVDSIYEVILD